MVSAGRFRSNWPNMGATLPYAMLIWTVHVILWKSCIRWALKRSLMR